MLLPLLLNLGFAAGTVTIIPPPITDVEGSSISQYQQQVLREKRQREIEKRIQIEDSEIIAIVEITLKHFII